MKRRKLNADPDIALRQLANDLAAESIVTQALSRYIYQIVEFVFDDSIKPLKDENAKLKARIAELEGGAAQERERDDFAACKEENGDEMCDRCDCWKQTRANCS